MADLFAEQNSDGLFNEAFGEAGGPRKHYRALVRRLRELGAEELHRRAEQRDAIFRNLGITFAVQGSTEGIERTWPMDLVPRIIPPNEWDTISRGLAQRVTALNSFLDDLYVGQQAVIRDGIVPGRLIRSSDGFRREAAGITVPFGARCVVAGIDLVRDEKGTYRILEDNLRVPSGISYVIENRAAMMRVLPYAFAQHRVRPVNQYGSMLLSALQSVAPPTAGPPTIAVLTPGVHNSAYFEHAFLAREMGVELVEGRDLVVDDHALFMRTTQGLQRVDVLYRRIDDEFLDPVVLRQDSVLGVPGLITAARAGTVTIANAVGNGVADDKAVYSYVPDLIRYYLGEKPILPNVPTYRLWDPEERDDVLGRLGELVVKPVAASGGYGIVIGPQATEEELASTRQAIEADPRGFIAQDVVRLSSHPTFIDGTLQPRHIDLRPFVLSGDRVEVFPGGLTRVGLPEGSLVVNSSQGGGSKDTWVLAGEEEDAGPSR